MLSSSLFKRCWIAGFLAFAFFSFAGCGGNELPTIFPVEGSVTLDGQPLENAAIMFIPSAGGTNGNAVSGVDGKFTVSTFGKPGAIPGDHRIIVTLQETSGKFDEQSLGGPKVKWIVPELYSTPEKSGLSATVTKSDMPPVVLDLKSK